MDFKRGEKTPANKQRVKPVSGIFNGAEPRPAKKVKPITVLNGTSSNSKPVVRSTTTIFNGSNSSKKTVSKTASNYSGTKNKPVIKTTNDYSEGLESSSAIKRTSEPIIELTGEYDTKPTEAIAKSTSDATSSNNNKPNKKMLIIKLSKTSFIIVVSICLLVVVIVTIVVLSNNMPSDINDIDNNDQISRSENVEVNDEGDESDESDESDEKDITDEKTEISNIGNYSNDNQESDDSKQKLNHYAEMMVKGYQELDNGVDTNGTIVIELRNITDKEINLAVDVAAQDKNGNVLLETTLYVEEMVPQLLYSLNTFSNSGLSREQLERVTIKVLNVYTY